MEELIRQEERARKHGPRQVETMPPRNVAGATISGSLETLREFFKEMAKTVPPVLDPNVMRDESDDAYEDLTQGLQRLEFRGIVRSAGLAASHFKRPG